MNKVLTFFNEVKLEVSKVTWPKRKSVVKLTLIVFLVSGILGAYVGGIDFLFTKALALIVTR
jgi:preprotein translocase subunit SecE